MWPFKQQPAPTADQPPRTAAITKAWAIDSRSDEGHGFLGIFWFYPGLTPLYFQDGMRTVLFRTRAVARVALENAAVKDIYPKARVVRVTIVISG